MNGILVVDGLHGGQVYPGLHVIALVYKIMVCAACIIYAACRCR